MIDVAAWGESRGFGVESGPASVTWGLPSELVALVVAALNADLDPSGIAPGAWAVAVQRADGSVAATSSPACEAGICWARREGPHGVELLVSAFVGGVVSALPQAQLNDDFIAPQCGLPSGATQSTTPFANVSRIPPGVTATWSDTSCEPQLHAWCGPETWCDPTDAGDDLPERYLGAFDESIDAMVPSDGPLCDAMSGGLDSTFLVASLARHAAADRPIHAFVHSPDPRAHLGSKGNWDPDVFPRCRCDGAPLSAVGLASRRQRRADSTVGCGRPLSAHGWTQTPCSESCARGRGVNRMRTPRPGSRRR